MNELKTALSVAMQLVEKANQRQTLLSISDVQRYLNKGELDKLQMHTQELIRGVDSLFTLVVMLSEESGEYGNADSMRIMKEADELKKKLLTEIHNGNDS